MTTTRTTSTDVTALVQLMKQDLTEQQMLPTTLLLSELRSEETEKYFRLKSETMEMTLMALDASLTAVGLSLDIAAQLDLTLHLPVEAQFEEMEF